MALFLIAVFLTLHILGTFSSRQIFLGLFPIFVVIGVMMVKYRKSFYDDFFANRRRNHFRSRNRQK